MKKKIIIAVIIILAFAIIISLGDKNDTKIEPVKNNSDTKYTHSDLVVDTKYEKINDFVNSIFDEVSFDGELAYVMNNDLDDYLTVDISSPKATTILTFYFDKNEKFQYLNIIYDNKDNDSLYLVKKFFRYSKFGISSGDSEDLNNILSASNIGDKELGNCILSKYSRKIITVKLKEEIENLDSSDNDNTESTTDNLYQSGNEEKNTTTSTSNNSNSNNSQNSNSSTDNQQAQISNSSVSVSKQNALKSARDYLNTMAFSRDSLIHQLEFEKFSTEDATYAVDNVGANWNEQAIKSAQDYLRYSAFSRDGLIKQLEFEKFTHEQAEYGVSNVTVDWNEQAAKSAQDYLKYSAFSRDGLIKQLEFEGFTYDQAVYGVNSVGL